MTNVPESDPFNLEIPDKKVAEIVEGESLTISDNAKLRLAEIIKSREGRWALRIIIEGGGCSGFLVKFVLEDKFNNESDMFFGEDDALFVVDSESLSLIPHACVDYHTSLAGSFFRLDVPDAAARCGCGESFAL